MTIKRVQRAAELRGIFFNGKRKWLNSMVGYGYEFFTPNGYGFRQCNTLDQAYRSVMSFPKLRMEET